MMGVFINVSALAVFCLVSVVALALFWRGNVWPSVLLRASLLVFNLSFVIAIGHIVWALTSLDEWTAIGGPPLAFSLLLILYSALLRCVAIAYARIAELSGRGEGVTFS